jgi:thiol-disulfide isomerase/thioredoxin
MPSRCSPILVLALALACARTVDPGVPAEAAAAQPARGVPEHIATITAAWADVAVRNVRVAGADHRTGPKREFRWTDDERAELEATRIEARQIITNASAEDRPWLLAAYVMTFAFYGIGSEWADALLDIPPKHRVWSGTGAWALLNALEESDDPPRLRAYVHATAAVHDTPVIQANSTYLHLEDADRAGDWERARQLHARLESIRIGSGDSTVPATVWFDVGDQLDPDRALRADTKVPSYCAPAILGPRAGEQICLEQLFPHDEPTLIIGWATWCPPCNEQLPQIIEIVRDRPIRVIAISQDEDAERVRIHLREHGLEDWTVLLPRAERPHPRDGASLDLRLIPFLALVDSQGNVEAGPPWLDGESLAARLRDVD